MAEGDGELRIPQKEIDALIGAVERMERRRKIMAAGYLLSAVVLVVGQIIAFVIFARVNRPSFVWIYFIPFALVGILFLIFGRWAKRKP